VEDPAGILLGVFDSPQVAPIFALTRLTSTATASAGAVAVKRSCETPRLPRTGSRAPGQVIAADQRRVDRQDGRADHVLFVVRLTRLLGEIVTTLDEGTPFPVADHALDPLGLRMPPTLLIQLTGPAALPHSTEALHSATLDPKVGSTANGLTRGHQRSAVTRVGG
jgi:hypothetical protein